MTVWSHSENYFSPSNQGPGICGLQPHYIKYFSKPHLKTWSRLKQINCERLHVYIISVHQRITKVVLHNLPSVYTVSKLGYTGTCFVFCCFGSFFLLFLRALKVALIAAARISRRSRTWGIDRRCQSSFVSYSKRSDVVVLIRCKVQYTRTEEAALHETNTEPRRPSEASGQFPAAPLTTSYSTYAFALFPHFGGNSSHDSNAECQRVGKAMFFSSWAEGAFGVQISHVTRCCDSFPARWH